MVRISILVSLFFFVGALLGFLVGSQMDSTRGSAPGQPPRGGSPSRASAPPTVAPKGTPAASRPDVAPRPDAPSDDVRRRLEEALAVVPIPDHGRGQASIAGQVLAADGAPVTGVVVRAVATRVAKERGSGSRELPPEKDLTDVVIDAVSEYHWERQTSQRATTDDSGAYVLERLHPDQRYTLEAYKESWTFDPAPGNNAADRRPGAKVDFVGEQLVRVPARVVFASQEVPYRASIDWSAGYHRGSESWYPHDPAVWLRPGKYELTARAGDAQEYASGSQEVRIAVGKETPELTFLLRPRPGIRGRVVFPRGEEVPNLVVYALLYEGNRVPPEEELTAAGTRAYAHQRGRFTFSFNDLTPGKYLVGAGDRGRIAVTETVDVSERQADVELHMPALEREDYLVLRVYGPDGGPLEDALISANCGGQYGHVIRRQDDSWWVVHGQRGPSARPAGDTCQITVTSKDYGAKVVNVSVVEEPEVIVRFEEPAYLRAVVEGYRGSGLEGFLRLRLEAASRGRVPSSQERAVVRQLSGNPASLDFAGQATFGPLVPGDYVLHVMVQAGAYRTRPLRQIPVSVGSGDNPLSVSVPALYSLTVQVLNVDPGQSVQIRPTKAGLWWSGRQTVDEQGQVHFEFLPAGKYQLSTSGNSLNGQMTVEVPATDVATLEAMVLNAQKITVNTKRGYLATAGFRSGDLVIGIDGREMVRAAEFEQLVRSGEQAEARLLVLREGEAIEIPVDLEKLRQYPALGGYYRPASR